MNVNKNDIVYAIYLSGDKYFYRKEKFIKCRNGYPICTVNMKDGITMGYDEICFSKKDVMNRVNMLNDIKKRRG